MAPYSRQPATYSRPTKTIASVPASTQWRHRKRCCCHVFRCADKDLTPLWRRSFYLADHLSPRYRPPSIRLSSNATVGLCKISGQRDEQSLLIIHVSCSEVAAVSATHFYAEIIASFHQKQCPRSAKSVRFRRVHGASMCRNDYGIFIIWTTARKVSCRPKRARTRGDSDKRSDILFQTRAGG